MPIAEVTRERGRALGRMLFAALALTIASCGACGSGAGGGGTPPPPPPVQIPPFDAARAFTDLEHQVAFGPRVPGSQAHADQLAWMKQQFTALGATVREQAFSSTTPFGGPYDFANVVAIFGAGKPGPITLVGAHWDSRPVADQDPDPANRTKPVPAANDGAAGVAILLELARAFGAQELPHPVYLACFDAEDSGRNGSGMIYTGYCIGSAYLAQHWPGDLTRPDRVLVLDLVGGTKPNPRTPPRTDMGADGVFDVRMEGYSFANYPDLVNQVWTAAESVGATAFKRTLQTSVIDDHMPFQAVGIPAIDLIDFVPPVWHTIDDVPEYCDSAALLQVGRTVLAFLYGS